MKKLICLILVLTFVFGLGIMPASAFVAPLKDSATQITENKNISLERCTVVIRPNKGYCSVAFDVVLLNSGDDTSVTMGIPVNFSSVTAVNSLSVKVNGETVKTAQKSMSRNNSLGDDQPYYSTMNTWSLNLLKDEAVFISISLTVDSSKYTNDTQRLDLPLELLNLWAGNTAKFDMEVYSPYLELYAYDKNPVFNPTSATGDGIIYWDYEDVEVFTDGVVFYSMEDMVPSRYYLNVYSDKSTIEYNAALLFRNRNYSKVIELIDSSLMDNDDFAFMKLLCHVQLGEKDTAMDVLDIIYGRDVLASGTSEYNVKDWANMYMLKMKYDHLYASKALPETMKETLENGLAAISSSKSYVFNLWASTELTRLKGLIKETDTDLATPDPSATPLPTGGSFLENPSLTIFGYRLDAKLLIVAFAVIIFVLIFIIISVGSSKKKSNKRKYRRF